MSEPSTPLVDAAERMFDAFLYAPIGLMFDGPDPFPALVDKGRNQVEAARMIGKFAVRIGRTESCKRLEDQRTRLLETLGTLGLPGFEDLGSDSPRDTVGDRARPSRAQHKPAAAAARPHRQVVKPDLAIPDYDSLSASQVVTRLEGLSSAELEAVRSHEAANRGRKTILNKVAQITG